MNRRYGLAGVLSYTDEHRVMMGRGQPMDCSAQGSRQSGASSAEIKTAVETVNAQVEELSLAGAWSASVVTAVHGAVQADLNRLPGLEDWRRLLETLTHDPTAMSGYGLLKYSKKGEVFRVQLTWNGASLDVVCKHSRAQGMALRLLAPWRPTKEWADFDRGLALLAAGIETAPPLAVLERGGPRREARLITQFLGDAADLDRVALTLLSQLDARRQRAVKNAIIEAICDLLHRMQSRGFGHRDLKATNILLTHWDSRGGRVRPWLVDLEGVRARSSSTARRQWQPLIRLAASLLTRAAVTRSDYCRFLQHYLERRGIGRRHWKPHFRRLAYQAAKYARRARRRQIARYDDYDGE